MNLLRDAELRKTDGSTLDLSLRETQSPVPVWSGLLEHLVSAEQGVRNLLAPALSGDKRLIYLTRELQDVGLNEPPRVALKVSTGPYCGVSVFRRSGVNVRVSVAPKVPNANVGDLLQLAGVIPWNLTEEVGLTSGQRSGFLTVLLLAFTASLRRLFGTGGLRRGHETRDAVLQGKIRGQLQSAKWLQNIAKGRPHLVPCRYTELQLDNLANRTLAWAAHLLDQAARADPMAIPFRDTLRRVMTGLDPIPLAPVSITDLGALSRLPPAFDHYRSSHAISIAALVIVSLRSELGNDFVGSGLAIRYLMHQLFEDAFLAAAKSRFGNSVVGQSRLLVHLGHADNFKAGHFRPDVIIPGAGDRPTVVADTKWKLALERGDTVAGDADGDGNPVLDVGGIKVSNADLFQILSYVRTWDVRLGGNSSVVGLLVYPVKSLPASQLAPLPVQLVDGERLPLGIYLVPWDVEQCIEGLKPIWKFIDGLGTSGDPQGAAGSSGLPLSSGT